LVFFRFFRDGQSNFGRERVDQIIGHPPWPGFVCATNTATGDQGDTALLDNRLGWYQAFTVDCSTGAGLFNSSAHPGALLT